MLADQGREFFDRRDRYAADLARPLWRARFKMRCEFTRAVGIAIEIIPIRVTIAKQTMHDGTGECAIGARTHAHKQIRLFRRRIAIGIDHHQFGAALASRAERVGHHIDLRARRIRAPDDDDLRGRHLAWIRARELASAGDKARPRQGHADSRMLTRIALGVAQAMDSIAHHEAHRAGVEIRPHGVRTQALFGFQKGISDFVERGLPTDSRELPAAFRTDAPQGMQQARGVMDALGVARDFAADHTSGVGIISGAADLADVLRIEPFYFERTGRRTVMRTGAEFDFGRRAHR